MPFDLPPQKWFDHNFDQFCENYNFTSFFTMRCSSSGRASGLGARCRTFKQADNSAYLYIIPHFVRFCNTFGSKFFKICVNCEDFLGAFFGQSRVYFPDRSRRARSAGVLIIRSVSIPPRARCVSLWKSEPDSIALP